MVVLLELVGAGVVLVVVGVGVVVDVVEDVVDDVGQSQYHMTEP
jgi:hypothetical protein